jgi:hypothetical protein
MPTRPTSASRQNALQVMLNEHETMRGQIEAIWQREAALFVGYLLTAAGTAAVMAGTHDRTQVNIALISAIILSLVAWTIELQFWNTLWFELYLVRHLRPNIMELVKDAGVPPDAILGFEQFKRERDAPLGMIVLVFSGSLLYQIGLATTATPFWIAALILKDKNGVSWSLEIYALLVAAIALAVSLVICVGWGYWLENFSIPKSYTSK